MAQYGVLFTNSNNGVINSLHIFLFSSSSFFDLISLSMFPGDMLLKA